VPGIGHRLAGCHHRVQDRQRVVAQESQHLGRRRAIFGGAGDRRRQGLGVEHRGGLAPVVAIVAHVQRLGDEGPHVDAFEL
jgi:hypothetical protein